MISKLDQSIIQLSQYFLKGFEESKQKKRGEQKRWRDIARELMEKSRNG